MPSYRFPTEAGTALGEGPAPSVPAITAELRRLGLPADGLRIAREADAVILEGHLPDAETRERVLLAVGNVRGIARVEDRMAAGPAPGLLDGLGSFARLPKGAASTEAAAQTVHAATPEPGEAFGPAGSLFHVVRTGETLASIAERHYGTAREARRIQEANGIPLPATGPLPEGHVLRVPPG